MFCKKCGKDIDIKNKVCPECGEETDFLKGIDGSEKLPHLEIFENEINSAFNNRQEESVAEEIEYEDISSYQTTPVEREQRKNIISDTSSRSRRADRDTYDEEDEGKTWKILATVCGVIILVCLIIIISVSCGDNKPAPEPETTTAPVTTVTETTTEATTVPTTEKPISDYLDEASVDDESAIETVQGFYQNFEEACAGDDLNAFAEFFSASYTEDEIKEIYDQYHTQCSEYSVFIPGITNTVSCDKYIYTYIAATTNLETNDYVENTFVLSTDGGAFKFDMKSDGAVAWNEQAPSKLS